jgi:hypothetical protein
MTQLRDLSGGGDERLDIKTGIHGRKEGRKGSGGILNSHVVGVQSWLRWRISGGSMYGKGEFLI